MIEMNRKAGRDNPDVAKPDQAIKLPPYQEPFNQGDFRGYFRWAEMLSDRIGGFLYHACHADELEEALKAGVLPLRSTWQLRLPEHGMWTVPGVWCGLNEFNVKGNFYGPCVIKFPIAVLAGRNFMVFKRQDNDHKRYFFVQHESGIPIYSFGEKTWRQVKPESYFQKVENRFCLKSGAIYDVVLTTHLPLSDYTVEGVNHPQCIPAKCSCSNRSDSYKIVRRVGLQHAQRLITSCLQFETLLHHFPCLEGQKIKLKPPQKT